VDIREQDDDADAEPRHIDLRGEQRRRYLRMAAACAGFAAASVLLVLLNTESVNAGDWTFLAVWAALLLAIALYYLRTAYGWVHLDEDGLRTSRWLRGRHVPLVDIEDIDTRRWNGRGGFVTVARVHLRSGRTYYLPAPRATTESTMDTFDRELARLRRFAGVAELRHPAFIATPLTTELTDLDFDAYLASPEVIRVHSDGRWPIDGFTRDEDRRQIAKHQADHEAGRAFTFLLLDPSRREAVGCLYLNPLHDYLQRTGADQETMDRFPDGTMMVTYWIRQDRQGSGLSATVAEAVNAWLLDEWPFEAHLFRLLPAEGETREAVERLDVEPVALNLPGDKRPYLWFSAGW
jgi:RimJ/RimL family protein N-acetyltransferase